MRARAHPSGKTSARPPGRRRRQRTFVWQVAVAPVKLLPKVGNVVVGEAGLAQAVEPDVRHHPMLRRRLGSQSPGRDEQGPVSSSRAGAAVQRPPDKYPIAARGGGRRRVVGDRAVEDGAVDHAGVLQGRAVREHAAKVHKPKVFAGVLGHQRLDLHAGPGGDATARAFFSGKGHEALRAAPRAYPLDDVGRARGGQRQAVERQVRPPDKPNGQPRRGGARSTASGTAGRPCGCSRRCHGGGSAPGQSPALGVRRPPTPVPVQRLPVARPPSSCSGLQGQPSPFRVLACRPLSRAT